MASLSEITSETRLILKIAAGAIAAGIVIFIGIQLFGVIRNTYFPPPEPLPEDWARFEKLPPVSLPVAGQQDITYQINTVTGTLPPIPSRMKVFKFQTREPNLFALQTARSNVALRNFSLREIKTGNNIYQWARTDGAVINYDIITHNFTIDFDFIPTIASTAAFPLPEATEINTFVLNFLDALDPQSTVDLDKGQTKTTYYTVIGNSLIPTQNPAQAQVARVDLYQQNAPVHKPFLLNKETVESLPIYYPTPDESSMYFYVKTTSRFDLEIAQGKFFHKPLDFTNPELAGTYPIKSIKQAYEDLQKGNAYIVNPNNLQEVQITEVSLGYYSGEDEYPYLVPIVIFKGTNFTAYVLALADNSIGN